MDILAALDEMKSMKSRHATVSVDVMLEALQRSNEQKERKLEEEDEALIRSVFKGHKEPVVVGRIDDKEIDDDDDKDLEFFPFDNMGESSRPLKRTKLPEEIPGKPTDILTKESADSSSNHGNNGGVGGASENGKFILKFSSVKVSIVKKPASKSHGNKPNQETQMQDAELFGKEKQDAVATGVARIGLQSLCSLEATKMMSDSDEIFAYLHFFQSSMSSTANCTVKIALKKLLIKLKADSNLNPPHCHP